MKLRITGRQALLVEKEMLVSGSVNEYKVSFTFDPEWDGYAKTAVFKGMDGIPYECVILYDEAVIPSQALAVKGYLTIGIYGVKDDRVRPTLWCSSIPIGDGSDTDGVQPVPDAAEPWHEALEQIAEKAETAEQAADSAEEFAEAAYYNSQQATLSAAAAFDAKNNAESARDEASVAREGAESARQTVEAMMESALKMVTPYADKRKIKNYLHEIWYNKFDYNAAYEYFEQDADIDLGACSTIRNGDLFARNFDWNYNEEAEFIVHANSFGGHYASIGIAGGSAVLTDEFVTSDEPSDMYKILPFLTRDGVNEYGVAVSMNVVPKDKGENKAVPIGTVQATVCGIMLPRYVLDHFKTAQEAVQFIQQHMVIYFTRRLHDMNYEIHYMIADKTSTYLVEIIDNAAVVTEMDAPYMTNFYLDGVTLNDDGTVCTPASGDAITTNHITEYGSGLERYNIIANNYASADTKTGMRNLLNSLKYTRAYSTSPDFASPRWDTEFVGGNLKVNSASSAFDSIVATAGQKFATRTRNGETWHTMHSTIYDIANGKMYLIVQEDGEEIERDAVISQETIIDLIDSKQDIISDLADIRSGASAGATAYQKPNTGVPKTDLATAVQTSLDKADTAAQPSDIPTDLADLNTDATHRTVTDTEKSTWDGKQNALTPDSDYVTPTKLSQELSAKLDLNQGAASAGKWLGTDEDGNVEAKSIPYATASTTGVIMGAEAYGMQVTSGGYLRAAVRTMDQYNSGGNYVTIGKGTLENLLDGGYVQRGYTTQTVTIAAASWSGQSVTVNVTGVTANSLVELSCATKADLTEYARCGLFCNAQGAGTLTFECGVTPTSAITLGVVIW